METFNTAMLLSKANELWDQMEEEGESIPGEFERIER